MTQTYIVASKIPSGIILLSDDSSDPKRELLSSQLGVVSLAYASSCHTHIRRSSWTNRFDSQNEASLASDLCNASTFIAVFLSADSGHQDFGSNNFELEIRCTSRAAVGICLREGVANHDANPFPKPSFTRETGSQKVVKYPILHPNRHATTKEANKHIVDAVLLYD